MLYQICAFRGKVQVSCHSWMKNSESQHFASHLSVIKHELHGSAFLLHPCHPAFERQDSKLHEGFTVCIALPSSGRVKLECSTSCCCSSLICLSEKRDFNKDAAPWAKKQSLARSRMMPAIWWRTHGHRVSALANKAVKVLSQPITSSACECCLSLFEAIQ